jgi:hypothetical protein
MRIRGRLVAVVAMILFDRRTGTIGSAAYPASATRKYFSCWITELLP